MKRIIYILALVTVLGFTASSCTDENVQPTTNETNNGGGGVSDPKN